MSAPVLPPDSGASRRLGLRRIVLFAVALVTLAVLGLHLGASRNSPDAPVARTAQRAPHEAASVNGAFTTVAGNRVTVGQIRGDQPAMVWFVAAGCASCAASIPAVQQHIEQLTGDGLVVITLGLYRDFPQGESGAVALGRFADAAAPGALSHPDWVWGVASKALSETYDPTGTPDSYILVGTSGQVRYRGSVPVSTMPQLLAQAHTLGALARTVGASSIPCC